MNTPHLHADDGEHRVLQFRPRNDVPAPTSPPFGTIHPFTPKLVPEPLDLSPYDCPREQPDDFRHRMLANIAALAFTIALTAVGIWLAMSIADLRRTQDCVLMGRRDCVRIAPPRS